MKIVFLFVLFLFELVYSWQLKDDAAQQKAEGEAFLARRREEFQNAVQNPNDNLDSFYNDLLLHVKKAQKNNGILVNAIRLIIYQLNGFKPALRLNQIGLSLLVNTVDGNRDNLSYYNLDYANKWIESRINMIPNPQDQEQLRAIQKLIVNARDNLDATASKFVNRIKDIKMWVKNLNKQNRNQIKEVITEMNNDFNAKTFDKTTNEAVAAIGRMIKFPKLSFPKII